MTVTAVHLCSLYKCSTQGIISVVRGPEWPEVQHSSTLEESKLKIHKLASKKLKVVKEFRETIQIFGVRGG